MLHSERKNDALRAGRAWSGRRLGTHIIILLFFVAGCRSLSGAPVRQATGSGVAAVLGSAAADTTASAGGQVLFSRARALAVDPAGRLYVADAGADVIVRLTPANAVGSAPGGFAAERLGGPGAEAGQFFEPSDVDATNGQVLLVADAGNSRIQRFSRFFRHLETLPVGRGYDAAGERPARPVYEMDREGANDLGGGWPVAVATMGADETLALDAENGVVLRWDAGRRAERLLGGFGRAGRLRQSTALAAEPGGLLFVGDGRAVYAFDRAGTFVRAVAEELPERVQALGVYEGRLWVVLPGGVWIYDAESRDAESRLQRRLASPTNAPLVDAAPVGTAVFFLTARRLHRSASWRVP